MDFQIKKVEGYSDILNKLVKLMEENKTTIKDLCDYDTFVSLELDTSIESKIGAYLTESHYNNGDYGIRIYEKENSQNALFIPMKFIDTIWRL